MELGFRSKRIRRETPPGASSWPNSMRRRSQPRRHTNFRAKYSKCVGVWGERGVWRGLRTPLLLTTRVFEDLGWLNAEIKCSDLSQTR